MTKTTIKTYRDGDSGELEDIGRFRLSNVHMPNKTDIGYNAAKRAIQKLVPEGSDVDVRVVGRDEYGRKVVEMRHRGKSVNEAMARRFPDHR